MNNNTQKSFFKKYWKEVFFVFVAIVIFCGLLYFLFIVKKTSIKNNNSVDSNNFLLFNFGNLFGLIGNKNNPNSSTNSELSGSISDKNIPNFSPYYIEGLLKIWDKPVSGYGFYKRGSDTVLQFVDSETGYIYEKDLNAPTSTPTQITNTKYLNVARAYFLNDTNGNKSRVLLQYADDGTIKTITANIPNSPSGLQNINNLPDNISWISTSPNYQKLVYVVRKESQVNDFEDLTSDWYKLDSAQDIYGNRFYQSPLVYWKLLILNDGQVYAYPTDTYFENSNLYKLVKNASSSKYTLDYIYGDHKGMSFLIDQDNLITSIATAGGQKIYQTGNFSNGFQDDNLSQFSFNTLSNKCTQNNSGGENLIICSVPKEIFNYDYGLPDAWYQGMTSFDDNLYVVNSKYPSGQLLYDFKQDGGLSDIIDAKELAINNSRTHLVFINKNDGSLWTLNVANILGGGGE